MPPQHEDEMLPIIQLQCTSNVLYKFVMTLFIRKSSLCYLAIAHCSIHENFIICGDTTPVGTGSVLCTYSKKTLSLHNNKAIARTCFLKHVHYNIYLGICVWDKSKVSFTMLARACDYSDMSSRWTLVSD